MAGPGPFDGGFWPYQVVTLAPAPQPGPEPEPEPEPEPHDAPDEAQGEVPPQLSQALRQMTASNLVTPATRPRYQLLGPIDQAVLRRSAAQPGLYLIEFMVNGKPQAYSGASSSVRDRLQDHLRDIRRWGVPPAGYTVYAAFNPAYRGPARRQVEFALHDTLFRIAKGYLRNRQREMEVPELGPQWA